MEYLRRVECQKWNDFHKKYHSDEFHFSAKNEERIRSIDRRLLIQKEDGSFRKQSRKNRPLLPITLPPFVIKNSSKKMIQRRQQICSSSSSLDNIPRLQRGQLRQSNSSGEQQKNRTLRR